MTKKLLKKEAVPSIFKRTLNNEGIATTKENSIRKKGKTKSKYTLLNVVILI